MKSSTLCHSISIGSSLQPSKFNTASQTNLFFLKCISVNMLKLGSLRVCKCKDYLANILSKCQSSSFQGDNFLRANCCGRVQIRIVVHLVHAFVDVIIKKGNQFSFSVNIKVAFNFFKWYILIFKSCVYVYILSYNFLLREDWNKSATSG